MDIYPSQVMLQLSLDAAEGAAERSWFAQVEFTGTRHAADCRDAAQRRGETALEIFDLMGDK